MQITQVTWLYSGALIAFSDGSIRYMTKDDIAEEVLRKQEEFRKAQETK